VTEKTWRLLLSVLFVASCVFAYPRPPRGTENIPALMAESTLVCKGEVVQAPPPIVSPPSKPVTRMTAVAKVRADRCFKGRPPGALIPVFFDGLLPAAGGPAFVLNTGDYRLFFLKPREGRYAVSDEWFGALPISRQLGSAPDSADSMYLLELDLKAGLADSDSERVLDSIRMLGNMKHLHSESELQALLNSRDLLVKAHVWLALLRLKNYSVLSAVAQFFASQPAPPHELLMPSGQLFAIQFDLQDEVANIRDPSTLPYLESFATDGRDPALRGSALQALRAIGSPHSATTFLKVLEDPNSDNSFSAMQGLLSLAGGGSIEWVPTWEQFRSDPQFYAAKCREWWNLQGKQKPL
jgi:hypothetical protein